MKTVLSLILALSVLVSIAACGNTNNNDQGNTTAADTASNGTQQSGEQPADTTGSGANDPEPAKLTGKLNIITGDDRDASILRGVRICGNCVGSADNFNSRESSLTDVRCIFELGEWIEFYPDTDAEYYLRVWVLKHRDDQDYYKDCKFSDLMPNFAAYCDLHYPADEENPDSWYWGNFYLHPDENETGYYDFVFTYEGKAIATLLTRFYNADEISGKSDAELEALMHE